MLRLVYCLALAVVLGAGTAPAAAQKAEGARMSVIVATAMEQDFVDPVEALGTTLANESVEIMASVTERITEVRFDDGQHVEKGDILVLLEKSEAQAALAAAEAILTERKLAFDRTRELEKRQVMTTAQLDERRAAMQEAEANLQMARSRLAHREIVAPFSGVVGLRNVSVGKLVTPGTMITTLDDLSIIKIDFTVPAVYLSMLRPGLEVVARTHALEGREFRGKVSSVSSRIDPVTRSITARAIIPNPDETLRPGLLVVIELMRNPRRSVVIPEEALLPQGRSNYVMVVDTSADNRVERREVTIGSRRPGYVEIVRGLSAGETVVTHGAVRIRPGQRVNTIEKQTDGQPLTELLDRRMGG